MHRQVKVLASLSAHFYAAGISYNANSTRRHLKQASVFPRYFQSRYSACTFSRARWSKTLAFFCGLVHLFGCNEHRGFDVGLARPIPGK